MVKSVLFLLQVEAEMHSTYNICHYCMRFILSSGVSKVRSTAASLETTVAILEQNVEHFS
jgi:hypothetical protein